MTEVTLQLPDHLYERAKQWATITQQDLDDALTDALDVLLMPMPLPPGMEEPVASLSDEEVLEQTRLQLSSEAGQRLSELLVEQREGSLSDVESRELFALAQLYHRFWLRQSEALAEAVKRGLHPLMHS